MFALLLGLLPSPIDAPAEEPKAAALVRQLGDPSFRRREAAGKDLLSLGGAAKSALEAGLKSGDIEVRERCKKLLPIVWDSSFAARIERLKGDAEFRLSHDLPGWERFAKYAAGPAKRQFAPLFAAHREAVKQLECDPAKLLTFYEGRLAEYHKLEGDAVAQLRGGDAQISLSFDTDELAFWLLALSDARAVRGAPPLAAARRAYLKNLLDCLASQRHWKAAKAPFSEAVLAAVVQAFVPDEADADIVAAGFDMAERRELKSMAGVAADWLARRHPGRKLVDQAVGVVGLRGGPEQLPALYSLMGDNSVLAKDYFRDYTTLTRDFALAMALRIDGQSPRDYGFAMDGNQEVPHSYSFGFKIENDRTRAFEQYAAFLTK